PGRGAGARAREVWSGAGGVAVETVALRGLLARADGEHIGGSEKATEVISVDLRGERQPADVVRPDERPPGIDLSVSTRDLVRGIVEPVFVPRAVSKQPLGLGVVEHVPVVRASAGVEDEAPRLPRAGELDPLELGLTA